MKKIFHILTLILAMTNPVMSQVGIGTQTPDASAELEVVSTDKGLLVPRLSSQDLVSSPAEGLLIYNTTQSKFYYYDGAKWQELSPFNYRQGSNAADEDDLIMDFNNDRYMGINAATPASKLSVGGNATIGSNYANSNAAPTNGLLVEGNVGIGVTTASEALVVEGDVEINAKGAKNGDLTIEGTISAGYGTVPIGLISMWSGSPTALPDGWALCDGSTTYKDIQDVTRTVPDLRGRFIVGYNSSDTDYDAIGETGGAENVTLSVSQMPSHNHGGSTSTDGSHTHSFTDTYRNTSKLCASTGCSNNTANDGFESSSETTGSSGSHAHTISSQGGGSAHENRPPYYTLAYIIRTQ